MAFKKVWPDKGTVIPESHRPPGSVNAALHELPAYRKHTHDLIGVVLFLPRTGLIVVPHTLRNSGGAACVVTDGKGPYPPGCHIDVCDWELQRAERVAIRVPRSARELSVTPDKTLRDLASGDRVWVEVEQPIEVPPDPVCVWCGVWLTRPGDGVSYVDTAAGHECLDTAACEARQRRVHRAPVQP